MSTLEYLGNIVLGLGALAFAYFMFKLVMENRTKRVAEAYRQEVASLRASYIEMGKQVTKECDEMNKRLDTLKDMMRKEREEGDKVLAESAARAIAELTARTNKIEMDLNHG